MQVMIEAVILSVKLTDRMELGVNFVEYAVALGLHDFGPRKSLPELLGRSQKLGLGLHQVFVRQPQIEQRLARLLALSADDVERIRRELLERHQPVRPQQEQRADPTEHIQSDRLHQAMPLYFNASIVRSSLRSAFSRNVLTAFTQLSSSAVGSNPSASRSVPISRSLSGPPLSSS